LKHIEQKIKRVTSVGLSLFNYQDDARSNKHKITQIKVWDTIKPRNVSLALLINRVEYKENLIQRSRVKTNKLV